MVQIPIFEIVLFFIKITGNFTLKELLKLKLLRILTTSLTELRYRKFHLEKSFSSLRVFVFLQ